MTGNAHKQAFSGLDVLAGAAPEATHYKSDTMVEGEPSVVIRARDTQDMRAALQQCFAQNIPVTFCAAQTSMTGSSVAKEGVLLATEKCAGILELNRHTVTCRPGTITADLQRSVAEAGFFFPVSPTSREMSCIGGNVATNASGEDSYQYGCMRHHVQSIKVLLADGSEKSFSRSKPCAVPKRKNLAGFELAGTEEIDSFIGSEGTLGLITEVTLNLLPREPEHFALMVPFASRKAALACVLRVATTRQPAARALELVDRLALHYLSTHEKAPSFSKDTQALLYIKQEYRDEAEYEKLLSAWWEVLGEFSSAPLLQQTLVAFTPSEQNLFREWRHHIPSRLNEEARQYWQDGGGKVGSDWWVPVAELSDLLDFFFTQARELQLPAMAYAHVGDGHPHTNLITKNAEEKKHAQALVLECCRRAVSLGGGVAGEHGIGKLHHSLLAIQHSESDLAKMHKIKQHFDPKGLLGRGNIFS